MHFSFLFGGFYYKNSAFPRGLLIIVEPKFSACGELGDKSPLNDTGVPPVPGGSPVIFRFWQSPLSPLEIRESRPVRRGVSAGSFSPLRGLESGGNSPLLSKIPPVPGGNIHPYPLAPSVLKFPWSLGAFGAQIPLVPWRLRRSNFPGPLAPSALKFPWSLGAFGAQIPRSLGSAPSALKFCLVP